MNNFFVPVIVLALIVAGLFAYLFFIDRRLTKIEKKIKRKKEE